MVVLGLSSVCLTQHFLHIKCAMQANSPHVTLSFEFSLADERARAHTHTHMQTQTAKWHVLFMNEEPARCIVSLMFALAASQRSAPGPLIRQRAATEGVSV